MDGKDTTVEELILRLANCNPKAIVRVGVSHDLDAELVRAGAIVGIAKKTQKLVILDCTDDYSHGFSKLAPK